jgi:hypothetical protein
VKGIFTLASAKDLLAKLRHDLEEFQLDPKNPYVAFNFFVTAEHMIDWVYPGYSSKTQREQIRSQHVLLQIVSHIANGAKHFAAEAKQHTSVTNSGHRAPFFGRQYFGRYFADWFFREGPLMVSLSGPAAAAFGSSVTALDLAEKVLAFWEAHPDLQ